VAESSGVTLYLVRHGETAWNAERRFQGSLDVALNERGREQARSLATWLAAQPAQFSAIYSSDLARAAETAAIIGEQLHLAPHTTPDLREIDTGAWSGLNGEEIERAFPGELQRWREDAGTFRMPGGESVHEVRDRVMGVMHGIARDHPDEAVIVVAHGIALSAMLVALHRWDLVEAWRDGRARMGNTGVTILEWDAAAERCAMSLFNSRAHLEAEPWLPVITARGHSPTYVIYAATPPREPRRTSAKVNAPASDSGTVRPSSSISSRWSWPPHRPQRI
jgi:broad specificity phosphatase PhoE